MASTLIVAVFVPSYTLSLAVMPEAIAMLFAVTSWPPASRLVLPKSFVSPAYSAITMAFPLDSELMESLPAMPLVIGLGSPHAAPLTLNWT